MAADRLGIFGRELLRAFVAQHARQIQREGAAAADLAVHRDLAPGLPGKAEHLGQAQASALADFLGGEERLEDARQMVCGMPTPVSSTDTAT